MTFLEEIAEALSDAVAYLATFENIVAFFTFLWESFLALFN